MSETQEPYVVTDSQLTNYQRVALAIELLQSEKAVIFYALKEAGEMNLSYRANQAIECLSLIKDFEARSDDLDIELVAMIRVVRKVEFHEERVAAREEVCSHLNLGPAYSDPVTLYNYLEKNYWREFRAAWGS